MQAVAKTDRCQFLRRAPRRIGIAGQLQRHGDIFQRRHGWNQMKRLEYDADLTAAKARQRILVEGIQRGAGDHHLPSKDFPPPPSPSEGWISPSPTDRSGRWPHPMPRRG